MIEVISRETLAAKYRTRSAYCSINTVRGRILFSVGATRGFGLKTKTNVLFFFQGNSLFMSTTSANEGFIVSSINRQVSLESIQVKIDHKGLVRMIKDRYKLSDRTKRFYMQISEEHHEGTALIEILINKPMDEIGK